MSEQLIFGIGGEQYGIDILTVKEIRTYTTPTKIVNSPNWFKGVIDLRGDIIPILDSRIKFNLPNIEYTETTVVIVITVNEKDVGLVVDEVIEVTNFESSEIQEPPIMEESVLGDGVVVGIGLKPGGKMTLIVNSCAFLHNLQH